MIMFERLRSARRNLPEYNYDIIAAVASISGGGKNYQARILARLQNFLPLPFSGTVEAFNVSATNEQKDALLVRALEGSRPRWWTQPY